jgi:hypothetical protein
LAADQQRLAVSPNDAVAEGDVQFAAQPAQFGW